MLDYFVTYFLLIHIIRTEESCATILLIVVDLKQNRSELKWKNYNDEEYIQFNKDGTYNKCTVRDPP